MRKLHGHLLLLPAVCLAQQAATVRWYNGNWKQGIPGGTNWSLSEQSFGRIYDDFVVPAGGWIVSGVFSNNTMDPEGVAEASWEVRVNMGGGSPGAIFASGRGPATLTRGVAVGNGTYAYKVQVDGLSIALPPGRYWLSVAPTTTRPQTYVCATLGANAVGYPPGNDGSAFYYTSAGVLMTAQGSGGGGASGDYSLGVIAAPAPPDALEPGWRSNIAAMVQQMLTLHSTPFPGVSVTEFNSAAADLWNRIPTLPDPVARTEFQRLVASVNDPHTSVIWPAPSPFLTLPLSFYWFEDGIRVTGAAAPYRALLGGKLVRIGGHPVSVAIDRLSPLVARDNDSWLRYALPQHLTNLDFLYGVGLTDAPVRVEIEVETEPRMRRPANAPGHTVAMTVDTARAPLLPVYDGPLPLARQHTDQHYWATVVENGATVYFQYNNCLEDAAQPFADFLAGLDELLEQPGVRRLVVDMRNNTGGFAILDPWIDRLKVTRFNRPGRLYVIVGRATFSAAMEAANLLHDRTAAVFVGEPTGAKPRFLLRKGDFPCPTSESASATPTARRLRASPAPRSIRIYRSGSPSATTCAESIPRSRRSSEFRRRRIDRP